MFSSEPWVNSASCSQLCKEEFPTSLSASLPNEFTADSLPAWGRAGREGLKTLARLVVLSCPYLFEKL